MNKSEIVYKNIDELIPYANNPRLNDDAVDAVAASIKEFGFKQPIVVDSENVIVVGHTRYKAAKKLGLETVPVIVASDLTPAQAKAYRLADNKVGESSSWDATKLSFELEDLDIDMTNFGFVLDCEGDISGEKKEEGPEIPFTEELLEENNYVVLFFDNSIDWLQAQSILGLKPVQALDSKENFKRVGVGRVINGTRFIERLFDGN